MLFQFPLNVGFLVWRIDFSERVNRQQIPIAQLDNDDLILELEASYDVLTVINSLICLIQVIQLVFGDHFTLKIPISVQKVVILLRINFKEVKRAIFRGRHKTVGQKSDRNQMFSIDKFNLDIFIAHLFDDNVTRRRDYSEIRPIISPAYVCDFKIIPSFHHFDHLIDRSLFHNRVGSQFVGLKIAHWTAEHDLSNVDWAKTELVYALLEVHI